MSSDASFLAIKQDEVTSINGYLSLFYIHVYFSLFVLLFGLIQLFPIQKIVPKPIHRISGYLYVVLVLFFAAPSGLYIGYYANGGLWAQMAFILLGIFWMFYTARAMYRIKLKDYQGHQFDMWRSYALALSALTLRFWKVILVYLFQPKPLDVYIVIAWLGWVLNLIIVERIIANYKIK